MIVSDVVKLVSYKVSNTPGRRGIANLGVKRSFLDGDMWRKACVELPDQVARPGHKQLMGRRVKATHVGKAAPQIWSDEQVGLQLK